MKKWCTGKFKFATAVALIIFAGTAHAQTTSAKKASVYFGLQGGVSLTQDSDVVGSGQNLLGTLGGGGTLSSETGFSVGGFLGYKFPIGLRLEGEVSYRQHGLGNFDGTITIGGAPVFVPGNANGHISGLGFLVNAWWDLPLGPFLPYIGGGAGLLRLSADVRDGSDTFQLIDDSVLAFAWQIGGGLAYEIQEGLLLSLDYRWLNAADPQFDVELGGSVDAEYSSHNILVGIRAHY